MGRQGVRSQSLRMMAEGAAAVARAEAQERTELMALKINALKTKRALHVNPLAAHLIEKSILRTLY